MFDMHPSRVSQDRCETSPFVCFCYQVLTFIGAMLFWPVAVAQASTIEGINHTHWAINRFSVDGRSGLDIIGPYQGGEGGVAISHHNDGCRE